MWRWIREHRLSSVRAVFVSNKNPRSSCMTAYSPLSTIWLWFILLFQDVRHKLIQIRFTAIIIPLSLNSGNKIGSWLVHLKQFIKLNKQTNKPPDPSTRTITQSKLTTWISHSAEEQWAACCHLRTRTTVCTKGRSPQVQSILVSRGKSCRSEVGLRFLRSAFYRQWKHWFQYEMI